MTTILGEHISNIRPKLIKIPGKLKDAWKPKYNKRPKTRKLTNKELKHLKEEYYGKW